MAASNVLDLERGKLCRWVVEAVRLYFEPLRWLLGRFRRKATPQLPIIEPVAPRSPGASISRATHDHFSRQFVVRERIMRDPEVRSGKPVIRGTRITVRDVVQYLEGGMTAEEILEDFPQLSVEDIRAAVSYAAEHEQAP